MRLEPYALSTLVWSLPPMLKLTHTEDTTPTRPTPPTTLNTITCSTTIRDPRQAEVPSSDGSFSSLLLEEEPPLTSCRRARVRTRRSLSSNPRDNWHNFFVSFFPRY